MPTNIWTGGGTLGDWSSTGNWSLGAAPVTGDDVIVAPTTATVINAGLSNAAVDLESLTITGPVTIGTTSSSLNIAVSNSASSTLRCSSTGSFVNITAGTNGIDKAVISNTGAGVYRAAGGTCAILEVGTNGRVEIDAAGVVTTLKQGGGSVTDPAQRSCGCLLYGKTMVASESCPQGKWQRVALTRERQSVQ